jgi:hypothetical protein
MVQAPVLAVKFQLEAYPKMPVAGWVYLGLGLLLLILTFAVRGMKFSGLMASLAFLLYYPAAYMVYWYVANYVADAGTTSMPGPLDMALMDPAILKILLITLGVLGGLFTVCMLESTINYRRDPKKGRDRWAYDGDDNPFAPAAALPPPLPGTRPPQQRPPQQRPAPGTVPPTARRQAPKRPGPPRGSQNPFDFT